MRLCAHILSHDVTHTHIHTLVLVHVLPTSSSMMVVLLASAVAPTSPIAVSAKHETATPSISQSNGTIDSSSHAHTHTRTPKVHLRDSGVVGQHRRAQVADCCGCQFRNSHTVSQPKEDDFARHTSCCHPTAHTLMHVPPRCSSVMVVLLASAIAPTSLTVVPAIHTVARQSISQ